MKNCKLINTTLAFEYSSVDAEICSKVDSVLNPTSGVIRAKEIGTLTIERDRVDPSKTKIICEENNLCMILTPCRQKKYRLTKVGCGRK